MSRDLSCYDITLTQKQLDEIKHIKESGKYIDYIQLKCNIILLASKGRSCVQIATDLDCCLSSVSRAVKLFTEQGMDYLRLRKKGWVRKCSTDKVHISEFAKSRHCKKVCLIISADQIRDTVDIICDKNTTDLVKTKCLMLWYVGRGESVDVICSIFECDAEAVICVVNNFNNCGIDYLKSNIV